MGDLLFNPNGRVARNRFWQGMVVLTVASVLVSAGSWLLVEPIGWLGALLIFPYICVYGKRLHDTGRSAWWVIGIWFAGLVIQMVLLVVFLFFILPIVMTPDQKQTFDEIMRLAEAGDSAEMQKGMEYLIEQMNDTLQRTAIALTIAVNAILGLLVGTRATMAVENQYGPVPGGDVFD